MSRDPGADMWSALSLLVGLGAQRRKVGVRIRSGKKIEIKETRFFADKLRFAPRLSAWDAFSFSDGSSWRGTVECPQPTRTDKRAGDSRARKNSLANSRVSILFRFDQKSSCRELPQR